MSRRYDTVIFDLDGTLLNTLEDLADGVNAALKHFGRPERTLDEVRASMKINYFDDLELIRSQSEKFRQE